jgi:predicted DNA-binding WGR domain protein
MKAGPAKSQTQRFEFRAGTSSKFWEIHLEGKSFTVRFGRIGTDGQVTTKKFSSPAEAQTAADKAIAEKLAKGYVSAARRAPVKQAAAAKNAPAWPPQCRVSIYATAVAFSPDGERLFVSDASCISILQRGEKTPAPLVDSSQSDRMALQSDGKLLAAATAEGVMLFDVDARKHLQTLPLPRGADRANGVAFSPDGRWVAFGTGHLNSKVTSIEVYSVEGEAHASIREDPRSPGLPLRFGVAEVAFAPDSKGVVCITGDGGLKTHFIRWNIDGSQPVHHEVPMGAADRLSLARDGRLLLQTSYQLALFGPDGRLEWKQDLDSHCAVLSPDGSKIVVNHGRKVSILADDGKAVRCFERKRKHFARGLAISVDGWVALGCDGGVELFPLSG